MVSEELVISTADKDKGRVILHRNFTVAVGCTSLSSGSPELELPPGEAAELLRV